MKRMEKQFCLMTKKVKDKICPMIRKKLESLRKNIRHCMVKLTVKEKFQVTMSSEQFTMDMVAHACSGRWWSLTSNTTFICYFIMFDNQSKSNK